MQKTVSELIIDFLKKTPKEWIPSGDICRRLPTDKYPKTISRTLQHLAEEKKIYVDYREVPRTRPIAIYKFKK